jgi:tetratricopeptide (TPR) repeat protein
MDLTYFTALYRNEVVSPLFTLVHDTLSKLRLAKLKTLAATLSLSNLEGTVPLELRFLKAVLSDTLRNPSLLDQNLPELLSLRKDGRHMESFFQTDSILTIYRSMEKAAPNDPSVQYDLYRAYSLVKDIETALEHLDKAIALDPAYNIEYLSLAGKSVEKKNIDEGLAYLQIAAKNAPNDPFLQLQMAEAFLRLGKGVEAMALLKPLRQEHWSEIYYSEIPKMLEDMETRASKSLTH